MPTSAILYFDRFLKEHPTFVASHTDILVFKLYDPTISFHNLLHIVSSHSVQSFDPDLDLLGDFDFDFDLELRGDLERDRDRDFCGDLDLLRGDLDLDRDLERELRGLLDADFFGETDRRGLRDLDRDGLRRRLRDRDRLLRRRGLRLRLLLRLREYLLRPCPRGK